jgi:hypothetical protein
MKKILIVLISIVLFSCGKKADAIVPLSDKIKKVWTADLVKEGGATVYTKGGSSNIKPGYSQFKLDLSSAASVTLVEVDGNTFSGTWELQNDTKLILKNLSPVPTGTGGVLEFTISSASESNLNISRTSQNLKTGNSLNDYLLK